jgi:hypothetical protein
MSFKTLENILNASIIQYDTGISNSSLISIIFRDLKKRYIKCNYNILNNNRFGKFILSNIKTNSPSKIDNYVLSACCNGIIFDYHTMKPLCIPPLTPSTQYNDKIVDANIIQNNYNIYQIVDGSTISLYWCPYKRNWCISSSNGLDLETIAFNTMTYSDIFDDIVKNIITKDEDCAFYKCLDSTKSYTFCITHPNLHPLQTEKFITIVSSVKLDAWPNIEYDWEPKEFRKLFDVQDNNYLRYQQKYSSKSNIDISIQDMYLLCKNSISILTNNCKPDQPITPFYGFMLRGKNQTNIVPEKLYNNVLIPSLLMTKLKELVYNNKFSYHLKKWTNIDRNKYLPIYHFTSDINTKNIYTKLFPSVTHNWYKLAEVIAELGENIINNSALENIDDERNPYKKYIYKLAKQHFDSDILYQNSEQVISFLKSKELVIAYYYLLN